MVSSLVCATRSAGASRLKASTNIDPSVVARVMSTLLIRGDEVACRRNGNGAHPIRRPTPRQTPPASQTCAHLLLDREVRLGRLTGAAVDRQDVLGTGGQGDHEIHLSPEDDVAARRRYGLAPREVPGRRPRNVHE